MNLNDSTEEPRRSSVSNHTRLNSIISVRTTPTGENSLSIIEDEDYSKRRKEKKKRKKRIFKCWGKKEKEDAGDHEENTYDYLDELLYKHGFEFRRIPLASLLSDPLPAPVLQYMSLAASYTVMFYFGRNGPTSDPPDRLSLLLDELLPKPPRLKGVHPPAYRLHLRVAEAEGLVPQDADGFSDPFCKVYLKGQKKRAQMTEVIEKSLTPKWEQSSFWFDLKDFRNDVVVVDVWDKDPADMRTNLRQIFQVKGLRGCWMFCQDVTESLFACGRSSVDDFMGRASFEVGSMFAEGIDLWVELKDEKDRATAGGINFCAKAEVERAQNPSASVKRHLVLVRICMEHGAQSRKDCITDWKHVLSQSAATLIFQHALQFGIRPYEDLMCKSTVVVELLVSRKSNFNFRFLFQLLSETQESGYVDTTKRDEALGAAYLAAVVALHGLCLEALGRLHTFNIPDDRSMQSEVEFILECIRLCRKKGVGGGEDVAWAALKTDSKAWLDGVASKLGNGIQCEVVAFLKTLLRFLKTLDGVVGRVYKGKTYTGCVYQSMEPFICQHLEKQVHKTVEEFLSAPEDARAAERDLAIELFTAIKEVADYIVQTPGVPIAKIELNKFHSWFGSKCIKDWFTWKTATVCASLETLAREDELDSVADVESKQTKGCRSACQLIETELLGLWKLVGREEWRCTMVWVLHNCCFDYGRTLLHLIEERGLSVDDPRGWKSLCAMTNSLWAVGVFAGVALKKTVGKRKSNEPCTKFGFQLMVKVLCRDLVRELWPKVEEGMRQVVEAKKRSVQEKAFVDYQHHIRQVFKDVPEADLSREVFTMFQDCMWLKVVGLVTSLMKVPRGKGCLDRVFGCLGMGACPLEGLRKILGEAWLLNSFKKFLKVKRIREREYLELEKRLDEMTRYKEKAGEIKYVP